MSKTVIEIEFLEAGQPRPYADSRYRARIRGTRHGVYTNDKVLDLAISEEEARALVRFFVHNYKDEPDWHEPRLTCIKVTKEKKMGPTELPLEWEVTIVQPFLD
jgi:hypothetical protein